MTGNDSIWSLGFLTTRICLQKVSQKEEGTLIDCSMRFMRAKCLQTKCLQTKYLRTQHKRAK